MDIEIDNSDLSIFDTDDFVQISPNWRRKYYARILKKRACAFLLDIFFSGVIVTVVGLLAAVLGVVIWYVVTENTNMGVVTGLLLFFVFILVIICLPLSIMESSRWKGTVGKRIMKIQITDDFGQPVTFWRSLLRNILKGLILCVFLGSCIIAIEDHIALIIPFAMIILQYFTYRKSKKLFHDYVSKTIIGERL